MKACDICGTEHEPWQAHVFGKPANTPVVNTRPANTVNTDEVNALQARIVELELQLAERDERIVALEGGKPKRDRKEYMREYMRKRREAGK